MRKHAKLSALTLAFAAALFGCDDENEPQDEVAVRYSESTDFTAYETFAIAKASDVPDEVADQIPDHVRANTALVNSAMRTELIELGLEEVETDEEPDLIAFSLTSTNDQSALVWECQDGYYWWGYWGYTWDPCAWVEPSYEEYVIGTAVVGLADRVDEEVVFGGVLQGVGDGMGDDVEERVDEGIDRIFAQYPLYQDGN